MKPTARLACPWLVSFAMVLAVLYSACASQTSRAVAGGNAAAASGHEWAMPIEKRGLPNLYRVCEKLYRGAQPSPEGFRQLKDMGVKTVINFCANFSDSDKIGNTGLGYEGIPMNAWHAEDDDVVRFLAIVKDPSRGPFFVHCQHGSDRTGMMVAIYRIAICGWTKDEAILEMTEGGFGYHPFWQNLVNYIRRADIEKLKRQAGLVG